MSHKNSHSRKKGFTLIEILVVVTIIGILASISLLSLRTARATARDSARKVTLRSLQSPLQLYWNNNGSYPLTGSNWYSSEPGDAVTNNAGNWIPGIVPQFASTLPRDPMGGPGNAALLSNCLANGWKRAYLYKSNGVEYKLLSHCAPEGAPLSSNDRFYDPVRPGWAWMVCEGSTACAPPPTGW